MANASDLVAGSEINVYRGTDKHFDPAKWMRGVYLGRDAARGFHRVEICDEDGARVLVVPARRIRNRRGA